MVRFITTSDEWGALMEESKASLVVIDFTASWCGPCQFIAPHYEDMAKEMPNITFVKIDVDEAEDLAAQCGVQAMPTFQFYKGGQKVDEFRGADVKSLRAMVEKHGN